MPVAVFGCVWLHLVVSGRIGLQASAIRGRPVRRGAGAGCALGVTAPTLLNRLRGKAFTAIAPDHSSPPRLVVPVCFRVDDATFDAILARPRAGAIACESRPFRPADHAIDTGYGGRGVYCNSPRATSGKCWRRAMPDPPRADYFKPPALVKWRRA